MPKKSIAAQNAPKPIGPYSQSVAAGGLLFISGQLPADPKTGALVEGGIAAQTERALKNVQAILEAAKLGPGAVVRTTIYLTDLADFKQVNEVYGAFFSKEAPARSTVQVAGLPAGARIEIDAIATF